MSDPSGMVDWIMQLRMRLHLQVIHVTERDPRVSPLRLDTLTIDYSGQPPRIPAGFRPLIVEQHHYTPRRGGKLLPRHGKIVLEWRTQ